VSDSLLRNDFFP